MIEPQQKTVRLRWSAENKLRIIEQIRQSGHSVCEVCRRLMIAHR